MRVSGGAVHKLMFGSQIIGQVIGSALASVAGAGLLLLVLCLLAGIAMLITFIVVSVCICVAMVILLVLTIVAALGVSDGGTAALPPAPRPGQMVHP
jgi:type III secretory pathway component EscV